MDETPMERLRRVAAARSQTEPRAARQRRLDASRRALLKVLKKKSTTMFVGALAQFEKFFGELWGHSLRESECTQAQLEWRLIWEECRNGVLDNGNHQVRAIESEVMCYEVEWLRHQMNLQVHSTNKGNQE